ncbi:MAG: RNA polymerase factor sigma-32 [Desulfobacterota bacterium]|nr:RNA polymerase factor sigma-32 [Thermodesulfobacteriota bacterium]MDW8002279.1 RNA polymerase factor sigma-32 [Deltaproteobacteria bacterium]
MFDELTTQEIEDIEGGEKREEESLPIPFDPLKKYLHEISKYPVLSKEEEFKLAERVYKYKDKEAAQKLVISNLRLVIKIALEYYTVYQNILDLIQEGNVGLLHAVKKYNPYKGTKFSTYASYWIRAYILKYIMETWSLVKIGTTQSQRKLFYKLNKERQRLEALGIFPAPKLLASTLDVKEEEIEDMEKRLSAADISLETPINEDGTDTLMDFMGVEDNIEEKVSEKEEKEIFQRKVEDFKSKLSEKERFIFEQRILAEEPLTLQEIGERFNISRERVRQLENRIIKKFKETFRDQFERNSN